ncbi:MAG: hypothetical protein WBG70_19300 [Spirulinaceae cyanobacterium]
MAASNPDPLGGSAPVKGKPPVEGQWYKANTVYQILEVNPLTEEEKNREEKKIVTKIVTKERGNGSETIQQNSFDKYPLDQQTLNKLQDYPQKGDGENISSYLPSSGAIFSEGFFSALSNINSEKVEQVEVNNFYQPIRTLLYSRKISQLIAKTWWSYLEAKDNGLWDKFTTGEWKGIIQDNHKKDEEYGFDILDGLIAREIFLYGGSDSPDYPDHEGKNRFYSPLKGRISKVEQARFLILPSSRGWSGVSLSLLLAGQAYYEIDGKYHQISQPIFSTGEITMLHSLEVDWTKFQGGIKELIIDQDKPWVGYHIVLPYPPIPSHVAQEEIKKWAWAKDEPLEEGSAEESHFPFYKKDDQGEYLIDVDYFRPPYPYIPLSCT